MTKNEIADVLSEIGTLLELKGENPFKVRAYQTGARAVEGMEEVELARLVAEDKLGTVKGIGAALTQKIAELHTTGRLEFFEKLKASIAPGLVELLGVPGLGPKKIIAVHQKLGVASIADLTAACTDGRVAALPGFGEKSQQKILEGIKNREAYGRRHLWWDAAATAQPIVEGLRGLPQVQRAEAAGSLRRGMETVGDLDFIVAATDVAPVVEWFTTLPGIKEVTAKGDTKASVRFDSGLQADLRLVPEAQFAFALHHFTGSKDHNVQMRQRALARGLSLSEWGLTPVEKGADNGAEKAEGSGISAEGAVSNVERRTLDISAPSTGPEATKVGRLVADVTTEADLFAALGLRFIPPELREGLGEIEVAEAGELPGLVELSDLRGAFHNHTTATDGRNTLIEMTAAAEALGWEYLGIADHSESSFQAKGMTEEQLAVEVAKIRALNASRRFKTHVFAGVECDILPDGRLDYDDAVLATLDYVVVSVHNVFTQSEEEMTKRIVRAIEHPRTTMLGHLTGRLLLRREGYRVELGRIMDAAVANHVVIELNASPWRLDMDWRHWRKATERGLLCAINPDAHDTASLGHVRAGVNSARKGWITPRQVLNTYKLEDVRRFFADRTTIRL